MCFGKSVSGSFVTNRTTLFFCVGFSLLNQEEKRDVGGPKFCCINTQYLGSKNNATNCLQTREPKVDRLYGWKACRNAPIQKAMKQQTKDVRNEFIMRLAQIITQFKEQGLNTELYYKNEEMGETISIVPTSAIR